MATKPITMSKHWKTIIAEIEAADSVEEVNRLDELSESKAVHKAAQERIRELTSATEENEVQEDVSEEIEAPSIEDNEPVAEKVAEPNIYTSDTIKTPVMTSDQRHLMVNYNDCPVSLTKRELQDYMSALQVRIDSISGVKKQLLKKIHRTLKAGLFALRDA